MKTSTSLEITRGLDQVLGVSGIARKSWVIINADSTEILGHGAHVGLLGDSAVDHVITDPPYDERTHANARGLDDGAIAHVGIDFASLMSCTPALDWLKVARRWVLAFCAVEQLGAYQAAVGPKQWVRAGVWNRTDVAPQLTGDRPAQGCEGIAIMHRAGRKRWNGGGARGVWSFGVERAERHHPTPKPVDLMMALVEQFTDPGDVVLDPYCGSGSTGVACLRLGRRFIGIERDPRYAEVAAERLAAEARGLSLSDARAGQLSIFDGGATP